MSTSLTFRVHHSAVFTEMGELRFLTVASFTSAATATAYRATLEGPSKLTVVRGPKP